MKRSDDVFFFTLIDFLLQLVFFGLFLFVLVQVKRDSNDEKQRHERDAIETLKAWSGSSTLTELTDFLTKLAPASDLHSLGEVLKSGGGIEGVKQRLQKLSKIEQGSGKPSCLGTLPGGRARMLASVVATDTSIRFEGASPELEIVLGMLHKKFEDVEELSLADFASTFGPLRQIKPECVYTIKYVERTRLVDARDAVGGVFYISISR